MHTIDIASQQERSHSPAIIPYAVDFSTPGVDALFAPTHNDTSARVYVSDGSCWVVSSRCDNGAYVWKWANDGAPMYSSPTAYDGHVFVGSGAGTIYKLADNPNASGTYGDMSGLGIHADIYSGLYSTSAAGGGNVYSTIAAMDGKLYFGCQDGWAYCVDASSMTQVWKTPTTFGSAITSSSAISASTGVMFTSSVNGRILALDTATGGKLWEYDLQDPQGENWTDAQAKASPATAYNKLFVVAGGNKQGGGTERRLYCFAP